MSEEIKLLKAQEAAALAGINQSTIYHIAYRKRAQKFFVRKGNLLFVPANMVDELARYHKQHKYKKQPSIPGAPKWASGPRQLAKQKAEPIAKPAPLMPEEFGEAMRLIHAAMKRDDFKPAKFARVARVAAELAATME